jgi:hypothetical protein
VADDPESIEAKFDAWLTEATDYVKNAFPRPPTGSGGAGAGGDAKPTAPAPEPKQDAPAAPEPKQDAPKSGGHGASKRWFG